MPKDAAPRRSRGSGRLEPSMDANGYVTLRRRLKWRGRLYVTTGIGLGFAGAFGRREHELAERKVEGMLKTLRGRLERGERPDPQLERRTLAKQVELWLLAGKPRMTAHTVANYAEAAKRITDQPIARVPLGHLRGEDVDRWLADLDAAGATSYQMSYAYERLLECLRSLEADGHYLAGVRAIVAGAKRRRPRHRTQATGTFSPEEGAALWRHLFSGQAVEPWATFFGTCWLLGLRFSEGAGLCWRHVGGLDLYDAWEANGAQGDPPEVTVRVDQQLDRHTRTVREPKSERAVRTLPLAPDAALLILMHRRRERARQRACTVDQFVFVNTSARGGKDRDLGYAAARRQLVKLTEAAGLTPVGATHMLRATFATAAGREQVPLTALQGAMGHADAATTLIYVREVQADRRGLVDATARRLKGG